jgi:hypothetical protein
MAKKIRIELVSAGFREILCSQEVADLCRDTGEKIAARAGAGFKYDPMMLNYGGGRQGGFVVADTYEAQLSQATDKVMEAALYA